MVFTGNAGEKLQVAQCSPASPKRDVAHRKFGNIKLNTEGTKKDKLRNRIKYK